MKKLKNTYWEINKYIQKVNIKRQSYLKIVYIYIGTFRIP